MTTVRSFTRASRAKAMRRRLSVIESSMSIAPRAPGPATIFSTYQTWGSCAKPPGSTAATMETALAEPLATWLAPSTGKRPKSKRRSPPASDVPGARLGSLRGPSTIVPPRPESSSTRRIASPAISLTRSGSPLPSRRAQASAAASVAWTSSSDSSPRAWNEGIPLVCCSTRSLLVAFGLFEQLRGAELHLIDAALQESRTHEVAEQRVRAVRSRAKLGVELGRHEPGVVGQLDDLHQAPVRRHAAENHPRLTERLAVLVVELEAVAVALVHDLFTVSLVSERSREKLAWIQAQAHGGAHLVDVPLLGHEVDHRRRCERGELRRVGVRCVERLTSEVDDRALHSEAQAEVRDAVVAGIARGLHLALDAPIAEPAGHHDAGDAHQRRGVALVQLLR